MGTLVSINVSKGGVPKRPRPACAVTAGGLQGDRQRDLECHGGPTRAVCVYSQDLIDALRAEGHPTSAGAIDENFTVSGVPWKKVHPGWSRLYARVLKEGTARIGDRVAIA